MLTKLDRYLASCHVGTKNACKKIIEQGQVQVNDTTITQPNFSFDPTTDQVMVNGVLVHTIQKPYTYLMLNKPQGYITATKSEHKKTVFDLIDTNNKRLFPIGRLDKDTEGLLLFTDDGKLAQHLLHNTHHIPKTYYLEVTQPLTANNIQQIEQGIILRNGITCLPASIKQLQPHAYLLTIQEGKYHQVKRMMQACLSKVTYLKRVQIGSLHLNDLPCGQYRPLTTDEIQQLYL